MLSGVASGAADGAGLIIRSRMEPVCDVEGRVVVWEA